MSDIFLAVSCNTINYQLLLDEYRLLHVTVLVTSYPLWIFSDEHMLRWALTQEIDAWSRRQAYKVQFIFELNILESIEHCKVGKSLKNIYLLFFKKRTSTWWTFNN